MWLFRWIKMTVMKIMKIHEACNEILSKLRNWKMWFKSNFWYNIQISDLVIFIFRKKVATFYCTLKEDWSGEFCGHFHAVLTNEGTHFPGILLMTNTYSLFQNLIAQCILCMIHFMNILHPKVIVDHCSTKYSL
jgi:hypothetical protein